MAGDFLRAFQQLIDISKDSNSLLKQISDDGKEKKKDLQLGKVLNRQLGRMLPGYRQARSLFSSVAEGAAIAGVSKALGGSSYKSKFTGTGHVNEYRGLSDVDEFAGTANKKSRNRFQDFRADGHKKYMDSGALMRREASDGAEGTDRRRGAFSGFRAHNEESLTKRSAFGNVVAKFGKGADKFFDATHKSATTGGAGDLLGGVAGKVAGAGGPFAIVAAAAALAIAQGIKASFGGQNRVMGNLESFNVAHEQQGQRGWFDYASQYAMAAGAPGAMGLAWGGPVGAFSAVAGQIFEALGIIKGGE